MKIELNPFYEMNAKLIFFITCLFFFLLPNLYCQETVEQNSSSYEESAFDVKIISAPARMRAFSKDEDISAGEFALNNAGFYIGIGNSTFKQKNGKFQKRGFSFGPYISFSSIKLNDDNTEEELLTEKNRLGIILGAVLFREINNLNIGAGIGFERLTNQDEFKWIYNKELFIGLFVGYSLK